MFKNSTEFKYIKLKVDLISFSLKLLGNLKKVDSGKACEDDIMS